MIIERTIENATNIAIVGLSTVMVCLIGFAIIISLVNKLSAVLSAHKQSKVANSYNDSLLPTESNDITDTEVALITAATTSIMGKKVRINKISFLSPSYDNTTWAQMSKAQKFEGHRIIQKRRVNYEK